MRSSKRKPLDMARAVAGSFKAAKGNEPEAVATIERLLSKWIDEARSEAVRETVAALFERRGLPLTDAGLVAFLRAVVATSRGEGERWRALRLPGDLKLDAFTLDRGRLHLVGVLLGEIDRKAALAADLVEDMRPRPIPVDAAGAPTSRAELGARSDPSTPSAAPVATCSVCLRKNPGDRRRCANCGHDLAPRTHGEG